MPTDYVDTGAVISDDLAYRYRLWRQWDGDLPWMVFIGLNPSTADALLDDPTIRRCVGFGRDNGCGGIMMVNLYAYRATKPSVMKKAADPVGPLNDAHLVEIFERAAARGYPVIAGWGIHAKPAREAQVRRLAEFAKLDLKCLGYTDKHQPRHPLFMPADSPLLDYREAA